MWERYALTGAGLEAGLVLAGRAVERGEAAEARAWLDRLAGHPDEPSQAARLAELRAWAAAISGDQAATDAALADLQSATVFGAAAGSESKAVQQLRGVLSRLRRPEAWREGMDAGELGNAARGRV